MNTFFKAALISAALAGVTVPALAQAQDFHRGHNQPVRQTIVRQGYDLFQRIDQVQARVDRSRMNHSISRQEARKVTGQLTAIRNELTRATSGRARLTPVVHSRFEQRIDRVNGVLRMAQNDNHGQPHYRR